MQISVWIALYFLVPALCLIGVSRQKESNQTLSKDATSSLRGIGMLLIIFVHGIEGYVNSETFFIYVSGVVGVSACFLVSGYGLFKSFHRKEDYLKGFLQTKALRMLLPYAVLYLVYLVCSLLNGDAPSLRAIFGELITLRMDGLLLWYLKVQLLCYVIFYLCYKCIPGENARLGAVFLGIVLWMIAAKLLGLGVSWYNTCLYFPLGMVLARYEEQILHILRKPACILCCALATVFFFLVIYFIGRFGLDLLFDWIYILVFNAALIGILLHIQGSRLLNALGKYSMEIYLLHLLLLTENPLGFYRSSNGWSYIAVMLLSVATAIPVYYLCNKIMQPIRNRYT